MTNIERCEVRAHGDGWGVFDVTRPSLAMRLALCGRKSDADKIARALNASGAVAERDALADAGRKVVLAFLAGTLTRRDIAPLVLALPDAGEQS